MTVLRCFMDNQIKMILRSMKARAMFLLGTKLNLFHLQHKQHYNQKIGNNVSIVLIPEEKIMEMKNDELK